MKHKTANYPKNKRVAILLIVLIGLALLSGAFYFLTNDNNKSANEDNSPGASDGINLSPPTETEMNEVEDLKKNLTEDSGGTIDQGSPPENLKSVTPIMGYLQQTESQDVESNGYIPGLVEPDGACTLTLTKGTQTVSEQKAAMPDAQSTICGQIVIDRSRLSAGLWEAKILYKSSSHEGSSETKTLEVK